MPDRSQRACRRLSRFTISTYLVLIGMTAWAMRCPWEVDHYQGTIVSGTPGHWYVSMAVSKAMNISFEVAFSRGAGSYQQLTVRNIGSLRWSGLAICAFLVWKCIRGRMRHRWAAHPAKSD